MKSFLVQEYGKIVAGNGKFGISAAVKNEMILAQAKASHTAPSAGATTALYGGNNVPVH